MNIVNLAPYATFAILLFAFLNFLLNLKDRKNNQETKTRAHFLNHTAWTNEGDISSKDSTFITLRINDISSYIFSGTIEYHIFENDHIKDKRLVFYFDKSRGNTIYLTVKETNGYREFGERTAKLKCINPEFFHLSFKSNVSNKEFELEFPTELEIHPVDGYQVSNSSDKRILTNDIIDAISPERNYDKVRELLGIPDKTVKDSSVFENINFEENFDSGKNAQVIISDLYFLKNAYLKVTTLDKVSIYSLSVFKYGSDISLPEVHYLNIGPNREFGTDIINEEIITQANSIVSIRTMRDSATAIQHYIGPPFYKNLTYFVYGHLEDDKDHSSLIGKEIMGFCLSDGDIAFYIYDYEMR